MAKESAQGRGGALYTSDGGWNSDHLFVRIGKGIGKFWNDLTGETDRQLMRELNQKQMEREDNAVQRRTEDMLKAGLSPYVNAGAAADAGRLDKEDAQGRALAKLNLMTQAQNYSITKANAKIAQHNADWYTNSPLPSDMHGFIPDLVRVAGNWDEISPSMQTFFKDVGLDKLADLLFPEPEGKGADAIPVEGKATNALTEGLSRVGLLNVPDYVKKDVGGHRTKEGHQMVIFDEDPSNKFWNRNVDYKKDIRGRLRDYKKRRGF